jgi:hypothetical protein
MPVVRQGRFAAAYAATSITDIGYLAAKERFVLCGWLLLSKTFLMRFMIVRFGLVFPLPGSGLLANHERACLRGSLGRWPSLSWMVSTNQVPFCISNNMCSGQSTVYLGSRVDNFSITSLVLLFLYFV